VTGKAGFNDLDDLLSLSLFESPLHLIESSGPHQNGRRPAPLAHDHGAVIELADHFSRTPLEFANCHLLHHVIAQYESEYVIKY